MQVASILIDFQKEDIYNKIENEGDTDICAKILKESIIKILNKHAPLKITKKKKKKYYLSISKETM